MVKIDFKKIRTEEHQWFGNSRTGWRATYKDQFENEQSAEWIQTIMVTTEHMSAVRTTGSLEEEVIARKRHKCTMERQEAVDEQAGACDR